MDTLTRKSDFVTVNGVRLHYLDWGGSGKPDLLFIPGLGCTAYIFDRFAPRFTDHFHVMALTRRGHGDSDYPENGYDVDTLAEDLRQFLDALGIGPVVLAGHSMGYLELSRFAVLYPERVRKLVFLDAAYDRQTPEDKAVFEKNPIPKMIPAWPKEAPESIEAYAAVLRRLYPGLNAIWGPVMEEELRHTVKTNPQGSIEDRMPEAIGKALEETMSTYDARYSEIRVPVLSFFAVRDGWDYLSSDYMTPEQQAQVLEFFKNELTPHQREHIDQFRRSVPQAQVVEVPNGHHYCFIKQEEQVYEAMRAFLAE